MKTVFIHRWHDHVENHKEYTKQILKLVSKFSKIEECNINEQKSMNSIKHELYKDKFNKPCARLIH